MKLRALRGASWGLALMGAVLGLMLTTQFRVQREVSLQQSTAFERSGELIRQLRSAETQRDALAQELAQVRSQVVNIAANHDDSGPLAEQLTQTRLFAGLLPVAGPGVEVVMEDSTKPLTPGENPNNFIIHDADVLQVINELAAAGAEAISVNGQRLIGQSEIRCTGPTVMINGVRTSVPIVITAIGDASGLETAINMRGGPAESLGAWGIKVAVSRKTKVTVPAYRGSQTFKYAKSADEEGASQ